MPGHPKNENTLHMERGSKASGDSSSRTNMPETHRRQITRELADFRKICKKHGLSGFSLRTLEGFTNKKGEIKKTLIPYGSKKDPETFKWGFANEDFTPGKVIYKKGTDRFFAVRTGKEGGNVIGLDCDNEECYQVLINMYPDLEDCLTVKTRKGYHIYTKCPPGSDMIINGSGVMEETVGEGFDIRGQDGILIAPPTHYSHKDTGEECGEYKVIVDSPPIDLPFELYDELVKQSKSAPKPQPKNAPGNVRTFLRDEKDKGNSPGQTPCPTPSPTPSPKTTNKEVLPRYELMEVLPRYELMEALVSLLPGKFFEKRDNWLKVGGAICSETNGDDRGFEMFCRHSRRAKSFENTPDSEYRLTWNSYKPDRNNLGCIYNVLYGQGIIKPRVVEVVKENSPHLNNNASKKFLNLVWELSEDNLAEYIKTEVQGKMWYSRLTGWWSLRENHTWDNNGKEPENIRTLVVKNVEREYWSCMKEIQKRSGEGNEDEGDGIFVECLKRLIKFVKANKTYSGLLAFLSEKLTHKNIDKFIDNSHNLFPFQNKVLDTETDTLREIEPEDWISQTTEYDFTEASPESIVDLEVVLREVMGDTLYYYIMCEIALSLCGRRRTSDILTLLGEGGNGKSVLIGIILHALGALGCSAPIGLFTSQLTSRNPELLTLKGKRFVVVNEPERQKNISTLVKMLDGDKIKVRDNYAKSEEMVEFSATFGLFFLCNDPPKFDGDGGVRRRLRCALFKNSYRENPIGDEKQADPLIKEKMETDIEWRNAFVSLLRKFYREYREGGYRIDTPSEVMDTANEVIEGGNPIAEWFNDNFERTNDPEDRVEKRDLYEYNYRPTQSRPMSRNAFSMAIKHLRVRVAKSNGKRYWVGIKKIEPEIPHSVGGASTYDPCSIKD